jgi:hypothetical protein
MNTTPMDLILGIIHWWKSTKLLDYYKAMARCKLGDGTTTYFGSKLWQETCMEQKFPQLASFMRDTNLIVKQVVHHELLEELFHLALF